MRKQLDGARAAQKATDALVKVLQDKVFQAEEEGKRLRNDLADREEEYHVVQKKCIQMKNQMQQGESASAPGEGGDKYMLRCDGELDLFIQVVKRMQEGAKIS